MAPPRAGGPRRSQQPNEHIYTLGERGRKTGVTLRDTGVRDEHGMEPLENIFSSPTKGDDGEEDEEEEEEEEDDESEDGGEADMDLTTGSGLDPAALINGRSAARAALRRSQSPNKALFRSPPVRAAGGGGGGAGAGAVAARGSALRNSAAMRPNHALRPPGMGLSSSPQRPTAAAHHHDNSSSPLKATAVNRRLNFGTAGASAGAKRQPLLHKPKLVHNSRDDDEDEENILHGRTNGTSGGNGYGGGPDDSMDMVNTANDGGDLPEPVEEEEEEEEEEEDEEEEDEEEPSPSPAKPAAVKKRGRPPAAGGSNSNAKRKLTSEDIAGPAKGPKRRRSVDVAEEVDEKDEAPRAKAGRPRGRPAAAAAEVDETGPSKPAKPAKEAKPPDAPAVKRGRKRKSSGVGAATAAVAAVPRGPPLPKSRGLVIRRRDGDDDGSGIQRTRSGRSSFRPLAFWRNEHVEFDPTQVQTDGGSKASKFLLPAIKEIHLVDEEDLPPLAQGARGARGPRRGGGSGQNGRRKQRRRRGDDGDDFEDDGPVRDAWETKGAGKILGEVLVWQPEFDTEPPAPDQELELAETEIAMSSAAIQTREVRDSSFRFTKTLSLPFFGAGMVDLPPGAEKRPKNARKMHMTFFVHYGQVLVTVNETTFRITKGGIWSVPRGNYYSIVNDTDYPARVFFAQGCEVAAEAK